MKLHFSLEKGESIVCNDALCIPLASFFTNQLVQIDRKLVRDLSFISSLAHYKGGMEISGVSYLQDNCYQVHFMYDWHIFHGCMGMDETGTMKDKASFTVSEMGDIQIDLSAFQALTTADEL